MIDYDSLKSAVVPEYVSSALWREIMDAAGDGVENSRLCKFLTRGF